MANNNKNQANNANKIKQAAAAANAKNTGAPAREGVTTQQNQAKNDSFNREPVKDTGNPMKPPVNTAAKDTTATEAQDQAAKQAEADAANAGTATHDPETIAANEAAAAEANANTDKTAKAETAKNDGKVKNALDTTTVTDPETNTAYKQVSAENPNETFTEPNEAKRAALLAGGTFENGTEFSYDGDNANVAMDAALNRLLSFASPVQGAFSAKPKVMAAWNGAVREAQRALKLNQK